MTCAAILAGPASIASLPVIVHSPLNGPAHAAGSDTSTLGWSSSNWSGYAVTAGPYASATGGWTVPAVSPTLKATYSSSWLGIDGFNNDDLIQTGTEQDYYLGSAHYSAWWEIVPAPAVLITSLTIRPGDVMAASIAKDLSGGTWTITLTNTTTGETFSTVQGYSGAGASAEWIQEAPTVGTRVATLAHFTVMSFGPGTVNGGNPGLVAAKGGAMVQNGVQVSTPSVPARGASAFKVHNAGLPGTVTARADSVGTAKRGVRLTWAAAAANGSSVTGYRIYRGSSSGRETILATVGSVLSYTDTTASRNTTSYYRLVAVNAVGAGAYSNEASALAR